MRKLINGHISAAYYIFAFLLSGVFVIPQLLFSDVGNYSLSFPQLSPAIAVLLIVIITKNRSIATDIKNSFFFSKKLWIWILIIPATIFISVILASLCLSARGNVFTPWKGTPAFYVVNVLFLILGVVFEEIGWRGFWLPELCKKYSVFSSSIIVGIFWGIWHMNFRLGIVGFMAYILFTALNSVLMSNIFYLTGKSLILMVIWHFLINLSFNIFLNERITAESLIIIDVIFEVICAFAVLWNRKLLFRAQNGATI